jgi:hypothetical protein
LYERLFWFFILQLGKKDGILVGEEKTFGFLSVIL